MKMPFEQLESDLRKDADLGLIWDSEDEALLNMKWMYEGTAEEILSVIRKVDAEVELVRLYGTNPRER